MKGAFFFALGAASVSFVVTANAQTINPKVTECHFPRPGLALENPASDFLENGPGMVLHTKTNLTWYRCNLGQEFVEKTESHLVPQCSGTVRDMEFPINEAVRKANEANIGGRKWRLPTSAELGSILESGCQTDYFNFRIFNGILPNVTLWTSSLRDGEPVAFSGQRYEYTNKDSVSLEDGLFTMNTKNLKLQALIVSD